MSSAAPRAQNVLRHVIAKSLAWLSGGLDGRRRHAHAAQDAGKQHRAAHKVPHVTLPRAQILLAKM